MRQLVVPMFGIIALFGMVLGAAEPAPAAEAKVFVKLVNAGHVATPGDVKTEPWIGWMGDKQGAKGLGGDQPWVEVGEKKQEVFASQRGGRLIEAQAQKKDGKFELTISGMKITPPPSKLVLKESDRNLIQLTSYGQGSDLFLAVKVEGPRNLSKPVEKNGLEVVASVPLKIWQGSPFAFTLSLKNASKLDLTVFDAGDFWNWKIMAVEVDGPGRWQLSAGRAEALAKVAQTRKVLKPGETAEVTVDLQLTEGMWEWKGEQEQKRRPVPHLPPGNYELTVEITSSAPAQAIEGVNPWWRGTVVTSPVKFNIIKPRPDIEK